MDPTLGFGFGDPQHPVRAGFELEVTVDILSGHSADQFLVTAMLAGTFRQNLYRPTLMLGVAVIHPEQIAGKDRRLIATGTRSDLKENITAVIGILRQ